MPRLLLFALGLYSLYLVLVGGLHAIASDSPALIIHYWPGGAWPSALPYSRVPGWMDGCMSGFGANRVRRSHRIDRLHVSTGSLGRCEQR